MTNQAKLTQCKYRMVQVDLRQGFDKCIEENQCFSDDPCPLSGKFDQPSAQRDDADSVPAVVNSFRK